MGADGPDFLGTLGGGSCGGGPIFLIGALDSVGDALIPGKGLLCV